MLMNLILHYLPLVFMHLQNTELSVIKCVRIWLINSRTKQTHTPNRIVKKSVTSHQYKRCQQNTTFYVQNFITPAKVNVIGYMCKSNLWEILSPAPPPNWCVFIKVDRLFCQHIPKASTVTTVIESLRLTRTECSGISPLRELPILQSSSPMHTQIDSDQISANRKALLLL